MLFHYLDIIKNNFIQYRMSIAGILNTFIQDMPKNAEAMSEIVDNFDKEKYKEVIDFARYANGGRPINNVRTKRIKEWFNPLILYENIILKDFFILKIKEE